jgi:hypothetical protein
MREVGRVGSDVVRHKDFLGFLGWGKMESKMSAGKNENNFLLKP